MTPDERSLRIATVEVERHCSAQGWDAPARLFALVDTAALLEAEPELAAQLGLDPETSEALTPIDQELSPDTDDLEQVLAQVVFPDTVDGVVAAVERLVLPPEAEAEMPDDDAAAEEFAAAHEKREEVRIVAGVLRSGEAHCVLRMRSADDDNMLVHGDDLVPGLLTALRQTLDEILEA